jgi:nucleoside-diphosphate-sugar epimerase
LKILLTGGTGFIGTAVLRELVSRKLDIDLVINRRSINLEYNRVRVIEADLLSEIDRKRVVKDLKADTLVHLAWYVDPVSYKNSPMNLNWLYSSLDLLRLFAESGGKRVVIMGTCSEYDWAEGGCYNELTSPVCPNWFYGQTKDALRRAAEGYSKVMGFSFLWGRLFWPYGPGESSQRLLSGLVKTMRNNQTAVCKAGNLRRDYIYIEDVAEAVAVATCSNLEGIINIASGISESNRYLAEKMAELMGFKNLLNVDSVPITPGNPEVICGDIKRLRDELGWRPRFTIDEGLKLLADYLK